MNISRIIAVVLLLGLGMASSLADDDDVVTQFREAMTTQNAQRKQAAVAALTSLPDRDQAYTLLLQATEDRQTRRHAYAALATISGVSARSRPDSRGQIGSGYPEHPEHNSPQAWAQWVAAWRQEQAEKRRMAELQQAVAEAQAAAEKALQEAQNDAAEKSAEDNGHDQDDDDPDSDEDVDQDKSADNDDDDAGTSDQTAKQRPLDRIIFTNGGTMLCHVITRRIDLDGQLTSVVIEHRDGGGREVIDAALIARIEEGAR